MCIWPSGPSPPHQGDDGRQRSIGRSRCSVTLAVPRRESIKILSYAFFAPLLDAADTIERLSAILREGWIVRPLLAGLLDILSPHHLIVRPTQNSLAPPPPASGTSVHRPWNPMGIGMACGAKGFWIAWSLCWTLRNGRIALGPLMSVLRRPAELKRMCMSNEPCFWCDTEEGNERLTQRTVLSSIGFALPPASS
jgi:hypothetical protein